jgi:hypothetical protein
MHSAILTSVWASRFGRSSHAKRTTCTCTACHNTSSESQATTQPLPVAHIGHPAQTHTAPQMPPTCTTITPTSNKPRTLNQTQKTNRCPCTCTQVTQHNTRQDRRTCMHACMHAMSWRLVTRGGHQVAMHGWTAVGVHVSMHTHSARRMVDACLLPRLHVLCWAVSTRHKLVTHPAL